MRRCTFVASAILLSYFSTSVLFGQHGGGGHSSGGSHSSGAHVAASSGFTGISRSAFSPTVSSGARAPAFSGYTGISQGALSSRGGRNSYGRGGFVPFFGYPYYLSTFDDYSDPSYYNNNNYVQDPNAQTDQVTANLMGEQINRLSGELQQMRAEQSSVRGGPYAAPAAADPAPANDPPIILVMQNGTKRTMRSYAVMGQTFWDFSTQPTRKIPFTSVNFAASEQATEASGAEFPTLR